MENIILIYSFLCIYPVIVICNWIFVGMYINKAVIVRGWTSFRGLAYLPILNFYICGKLLDDDNGRSNTSYAIGYPAAIIGIHVGVAVTSGMQILPALLLLISYILKGLVTAKLFRMYEKSAMTWVFAFTVPFVGAALYSRKIPEVPRGPVMRDLHYMGGSAKQQQGSVQSAAEGSNHGEAEEVRVQTAYVHPEDSPFAGLKILPTGVEEKIKTDLTVWYYAEGSQQVKCTAEFARELPASTLVWTAGMSNWTKAGECDELFE